MYARVPDNSCDQQPDLSFMWWVLPQELLEPGTIAAVMQVPLQAVVAAVGRVQHILGGNSTAISPLRVLKLYLERLACDTQDMTQTHGVCGDALAAMDRVALSPAFLSCPPSVTAMAVLYASRLSMGVFPPWPFALYTLTGYSCPNDTLQRYIQLAMAVVQGIC